MSEGGINLPATPLSRPPLAGGLFRPRWPEVETGSFASPPRGGFALIGGQSAMPEPSGTQPHIWDIGTGTADFRGWY
jgi:hypothetical protein